MKGSYHISGKVLSGLVHLRNTLTGTDSINYINGPETLPPPLKGAEEAKVMERIEKGDEKAREVLITHNLRLVVYIAKKFESPSANVEDLISIGTIGLIKAVNTFCPSRNIKLATYASRCIENEILMYFRGTKKNSLDISMNEEIDSDADGNALTLTDIMSVEDNIVDELDLKMKIEKLAGFIKKCLSPREALIIRLRYGLDSQKPLTQREVSSMLKISRSYVSRIEKKALLKLRKQYERCSL